MFKNYLKIAFRTLLRNKLFTFINTFGLSLGVGCCLLILLFVKNELSFDRFHENSDRLFRLYESGMKVNGEIENSAFLPLPIAPSLKNDIPEIENYTRLLTAGGTMTYGDKVFSEAFLFVDPEFLQMFSFKIRSGATTQALTNQGIVITPPVATKYFGNDDPVGKTLTISQSHLTTDFIVSAVTEEVPVNSSIEFAILMPISRHSRYASQGQSWRHYNGSSYVLLKDGADRMATQQKLSLAAEKYFGERIKRMREQGNLSESQDAYQLRLQPVTAIHLDTKIQHSPEPVSHPVYSYILSGIALLVLGIACINFVTLSISRASSRTREIGVRKVLGAKRLQLLRQFWGEALLLSLLAMVFGVVLAEFLLPMLQELARTTFATTSFTDSSLVLFFPVLLLLVSLIAGGYPAAYLSKFQPVAALSGKLKLHHKNLFTRILVAFQFGLSIFLIVCSLFMANQLRYMLNKNLGYDAEHVVVVPTFARDGKLADERVDRLQEELARRPEIVIAARTSASFTRGWDRNGFKHNGVLRRAFVYRVDENYLNLMAMELKEGRNFTPGMTSDIVGSVIVNEALVKEFGLQEPVVGKRLGGWNEKNVPGGPVIIGVVKDYNFLSLKNQIGPAFLTMDPNWFASEVLIRIRGENIPGTLQLLEATWKKIAPEAPFAYSFLDENVARQYDEEKRWGSIITFSSLLAILLACLGLLGLVANTVSNRAKEVSIRKVLGASVANLVETLTSTFLKLILVANIIAWPLAWYAMNPWLQNFAYRIDISLWVFALAGGIAFLIAFLTVGVQALRAAVANPVEALRYE